MWSMGGGAAAAAEDLERSVKAEVQARISEGGGKASLDDSDDLVSSLLSKLSFLETENEVLRCRLRMLCQDGPPADPAEGGALQRLRQERDDAVRQLAELSDDYNVVVVAERVARQKVLEAREAAVEIAKHGPPGRRSAIPLKTMGGLNTRLLELAGVQPAAIAELDEQLRGYGSFMVDAPGPEGSGGDMS
eukprot:RCo005872